MNVLNRDCSHIVFSLCNSATETMEELFDRNAHTVSDASRDVLLVRCQSGQVAREAVANFLRRRVRSLAR